MHGYLREYLFYISISQRFYQSFHFFFVLFVGGYYSGSKKFENGLYATFFANNHSGMSRSME